MKLLNYTLIYLSISLFAILSIWSVAFYINMLEEVKASIDDGLDNYKMLIVYRAQEDSTMLQPAQLAEKNYSIKEISPGYALQLRDVYKDTLIYMQRNEAYKSFRLLRTAFGIKDGRFYELKVVSSAVNKSQLIKKLLVSFLGLYLIILASMIIVNKFVLQKIWKPFYQILQQLKDYKLGISSFIPSTKIKVKEFAVLKDTTNSLLKRNQEVFNSQKQFIENAAHELQTPLAISINRLELLAEKNSLPEEDIQEVAKVIQTLEGLTRLNKSLLLLSKIENSQFKEEHIINFNLIFNTLINDFSDLAEFREVKVVYVEEGEFKSKMNSDLAKILVMNLLRNAIIHNHPHGEVIITITTTSFTIANTGEPQSMDNSKIFERFYKKSSENSSTGLGLAIVKAITDFYGLSITYIYTGKHVITISI